jgi:hypothetical protein
MNLYNDNKNTKEYIKLLYNAGQSLQRIETFIETLKESSLFPKNLSKNKEEKIKQFLKTKLLPENAQNILNEYKTRVEMVNNYSCKDE